MPPGERHERNEKEEKERHEEEEKREEKHEKEQPRDALSSVMWALFLIVAGVILLAESQGWVTWDQFGGLWNLFFVGIGLLVLLEAVLRLMLPAFRRPVLGQVIAGVVLLAIGFGGMTGLQLTGPVILIGIGLAILLGGLFRGRV
jgi:cation transport ATPase